VGTPPQGTTTGAEPARSGDDEIVVRPLAPGEARALATVMRRSFGGLAGMMFSPGKAAFVAELGGRVVGGVTLGVFRIDAERRGGVVKWLFTLPEARGHGVATALVDRALAWFDDHDVTDAIACVEALNAGSSNRFAQRGFAPLGFVGQVRRYGWRLPRVWWHANHVVDVGHVLWVRMRNEAPTEVPDEATAWGAGGLFATAGLHLAFGIVMLARLGETIDATAVAQVTAAVVAIVGVRTAAMAVVGRAQGLHLRYLPWETGLLLAGAIALVFGGPFVAPGAVVPRSRTWPPRSLAPALARMAVAAPAAVLTLGWLAWWAVAAGVATDLAEPVLLYTRIMLLADVLLPFFPMTAFAGRRVLEASPLAWGALAAGTVALWLVAPAF
jgi:GNAT superfamily N-acetyltransferase